MIIVIKKLTLSTECFTLLGAQRSLAAFSADKTYKQSINNVNFIAFIKITGNWILRPNNIKSRINTIFSYAFHVDNIDNPYNFQRLK